MGATAVGHVSISVLAIDNPPVAVDDSLTLSEDTTSSVAVLANDTDPDGETLTATAITTQPGHGSATIAPDGTIAYTPAPNYNGQNAFSYEVTDGPGLTDEGAVAVTVTPVNDAPTATADQASTAEDTVVIVPVLANDDDMDGDTLAVDVTSQGFGDAVANPDGTVTYTPPAGYNGDDSFGYAISDGHGGTASASVSVSISEVNDAPTAAPKSISTAYQKAVTIQMAGTDVETCDLTFQIVSGPVPGSLGTIANLMCIAFLPPYLDWANVTYTPAAGYSGAGAPSPGPTSSSTRPPIRPG